MVVNAEIVQVDPGTQVTGNPTRSYRRFDTIAIMNTKQLLFAFAFALLVVFTGSPVSVHTQHMSEKDSSAKARKIWRRFN